MKKEFSFKETSQNQINNKKNRLWVITELYYPENNQTGYYMTKIAEGLSQRFDVKVICGQPNYAARGTLAPKKEIHKRVEIFRVWSTTLNKDVIIFRLINMLTIGASMFVKMLTNIEAKSEILVVSAPPSLPFITAFAAKICRAKYSLIIQDKYPETLVAVGKAKTDSIFIKTLNKLNRWLYKNSEKIVVVGRDMREIVQSQIDEVNSGSKPRLKVIQNWAALEEVEPASRQDNELLKELGIIEKFIFLYAGNMGYPQDIESIVYCAEKLKNDDRFHFLFLGSGVKRKWLEGEVETKKLKNVTVLAPRPRNEQKIFLNACDIGLVPLVKKMWGVAMPSRTYNFLAAGKPVLALTETDSEVARVIEEDKVGWFVPPCEPEMLLQMIYKIFEEREKISEMSSRARQSALEKYSVQVAIEKYNDFFR
jgi:glycosyltransferase involved in cell wall biosynthesis